MAKRKLKDVPIQDEGPDTKKIKVDENFLHLSCPFSSLPLEIISEYIFKYFDFQVCLKSLVPVCKQWHLAAQVSSMPKQVAVLGVTSIQPMLATYNIDTLILQPAIKQTSLKELAQILSTVPKVTTLVCKAGCAVDRAISNEWHEYFDDTLPTLDCVFEHIKTLSISRFGPSLAMFPNLTQLKIEALWSSHAVDQIQPSFAYPTITELELNVVSSDPLFNITNIFPAVKTVHIVNDYGKSSLNIPLVTSKNPGVNFILHTDLPNVTTQSAYVDYFNSFGRTPLQYFLEKKDGKMVKEMLTKFTNEAYERDMLMRHPQFKFPTKHPYFSLHASEVKKSSLSSDMLDVMTENGGVNYWGALTLYPDTNNVTKALRRANQHRPVPLEALKSIVKLNCHRSLSVNQVAELVDEDTFKEIATLKDVKGNTLLHLLARKNANLPMYWDKLIAFSDIHALNYKEDNAATIAFQARYWSCWQMLVEQGTAVQHEKYAKDLPSTRHFLAWVLNSAISFRILKHFKEFPSYVQLMFFELQHLTSPRKHYLFRKLLQMGVDPKQYNRHGQSLLNMLVEQTNELTSEWECLAECNLNLDECDSIGKTPLITAIKLGMLKKAQFLLEKGANPNAHGLTSSGKKIYPVQLAQTVTDREVIKLLAEYGADFTIEDNDGNTILNAAVVRHKFVEINALAAHIPINKSNKHNMTPLAQAICLADLTKVKACLASGADVNQIAGPMMQSPLLLALEEDDQTIVESLLATGRINLTLKDKAGRSFVNYFLRTDPMWKPSSEMRKNIKAHYATPDNISFVKGEVETILTTPAMSPFATKILKFATKNLTFTKFFVEVLGINPNTEDSNGDTMLSLVQFHPRKSPPVIDFLVSRGANVNHQNRQKNTPLMKAMDVIASDKDDEHVIILLKHGASVEIKNIWGLAPIDIDPTITQKLVNYEDLPPLIDRDEE